MKIKLFNIHPFIAKPFHFLFTPWRKYSEYFDIKCQGFWGLSPLLKFTFIFLALFFVLPIVGLVNYTNNDTYFSVITIFFLLIAFIWIIYFPILSIITLLRALKKVKSAVKNLNTKLKDEPWNITPIKLYTQPQRPIVVYLILLKYYLIDVLDWSTQFYPVSLLSTSSIRYPLSTKIRRIARLLESRIAQLYIPLKYVDLEINQQYTLYKFELYEDVKDFTKMARKLTKGLKYSSSFYIRQENEQIHIIVPHLQ